MKCTGEHQVVVGAQFVQASVVKRLVVDEAACLVDDNEAEYSPCLEVSICLPDIGEHHEMSHILASSYHREM